MTATTGRFCCSIVTWGSRGGWPGTSASSAPFGLLSPSSWVWISLPWPPMQHNLSSSHVPGPRIKSILSISVSPVHLKSCPLLTGDYTFSPISDFRQLLRIEVPWVKVTCATGRKNKCSSLSGRYPPGYYGKKSWSGGDLSAKLVKIAFKVLQRRRLLIILHANYFYFCHVLPSCILWERKGKSN